MEKKNAKSNEIVEFEGTPLDDTAVLHAKQENPEKPEIIPVIQFDEVLDKKNAPVLDDKPAKGEKVEEIPPVKKPKEVGGKKETAPGPVPIVPSFTSIFDFIIPGFQYIINLIFSLFNQ